MYKLRTMTADAEESLSEIVRLEDLREPMFKLPNDPRVTRVGRLLRRWPIATMSVLAVTVVPTVLQFPVPAVRLALWRDPAARFRPRVAPPAGWRHRG